MAMGPEVPAVPEVPDWPAGRARRPDARTVLLAVGLVAVSVLLGLLGGLIWAEVAPRVLYQEVAAGAAEVVNAETRAYFGADLWFCVIAVLAGLLTGVLGYRFAVASRTGFARAAAALGLILGAVGGGFAMMWLGGQIGLSAFNHHLASSSDGSMFNGSLALGAKSALACWPLFTAAVLLIVEWSTRPGTDRPAPAPPAPLAPPGPPAPPPP